MEPITITTNVNLGTLPNNGQLLPEGAFNPVENGGFSRSAVIQSRTLKIKIPIWWYFKVQLVPFTGAFSTLSDTPGGISETPPSAIYKPVLLLNPGVRRAYYAAGLPFAATVEEYGPYRDTDNCIWPEEGQLLTTNFEFMEQIYEYGYEIYTGRAKAHVQKYLDNIIVHTVRKYGRQNLFAYDVDGRRLGTWARYKEIFRLDELFATANLNFRFRLDLVCHQMCNGEHMQEGRIAYITRPLNSDQELTDMNPDQGGLYEGTYL